MSWGAALWGWLDANSRQIGAISSMTFGLSSAVVAWVALTLSYRNNYGRKPMVFVMNEGTGDAPGDKDKMAFYTFEVWNRRKYPLVIRQIKVIPKAVVLREAISKKWSLTRAGTLVMNVGETLKAEEVKEFTAKGIIEKFNDIADDSEWSQVSVTYFDGRKNRYYVLTDDSLVGRRERWQRMFRRLRVPVWLGFATPFGAGR